jgi:spore coat polysaccharide biosynthesis protein SpsF
MEKPDSRKATAILQGRIGSTRLPGKVLLPLVGKPVMQHVYERILHCKNIDRIIVATTPAPRDDPIVKLFEKIGVTVFRGSEADPLDRYYRAATHHGAEHIVRIMADCPLVDPEVVDEVIEMYFNGSYDSCYLGGEFPTGLDTTVFSYGALEKCWKEGHQTSDREHITSYMSNNPELFKIGVLEKFEGLFHHRWVMDHEADYKLMVEIYDALYKPGKVFISGDVLKLLEEHPQLFQINSGIPRDEGYKKSIKQAQNLDIDSSQ